MPTVALEFPSRSWRRDHREPFSLPQNILSHPLAFRKFRELLFLPFQLWTFSNIHKRRGGSLRPGVAVNPITEIVDRVLDPVLECWPVCSIGMGPQNILEDCVDGGTLGHEKMNKVVVVCHGCFNGMISKIKVVHHWTITKHEGTVGWWTVFEGKMSK